ncbi:MAG: GvpL/GvpF family gas vesicle protein [Deltaproteobacteria bacterium]
MQSAQRAPKYLYAVMKAPDNVDLTAKGVADRTVFAIDEQGIAALASDLPAKRIRPQRRHFAAHQAVLKELMERDSLLPMSFGVVADNAAKVRRFLAENRSSIEDQLDRVQGKVEMGLRVTWDLDNIFEFMIRKHPELMAARDQAFGNGASPSRDQMIEIGRMFESFLSSDRQAHYDRVWEKLTPHCFEIKNNACREECEVMNMACLVGRNAVDRFEQGVFVAAAQFDNDYAFDYSGPWAPYNFVDLSVDLS